MLCLIVMEMVPPQKICNIQIQVVQICPTLPSYQMKKSQDNFSDNRNNKDRFIAGLSNRLSQNGFQCVADADTTIAKVALEHQ